MVERKALGADTLLADGEMQQVTVEGARNVPAPEIMKASAAP
jgi:hypothetical protein